MTISETWQVDTPLDSEEAYITSWRHQVCAGLKQERKLHRIIKSDDLLPKYMDYLSLIDDEEFLLSFEDPSGLSPAVKRDFLAINKAYSIFKKASKVLTREKIEALLLCPELTYEGIAYEFNLNPDVIDMYERLYFNVRDTEHKVLANKGVLEYCVLQGNTGFAPVGLDIPGLSDKAALWRTIAFEGGHKPLYFDWRWHMSSTTIMDDVEQMSALARDGYRALGRALRMNQQVDQRGFMQLLTNLSDQLAQLRRDGILSNSEKVTEQSVLLQIVGLFPPQRIKMSESKMQERQKLVDDKLSAVKARAGIAKDSKPTSFHNIESQLNK
jgi:hypothetical protein